MGSTDNRGDPARGSLRSDLAHRVRVEHPKAFRTLDLGGPLVVAVLWLVLPFEVSDIGRWVGASIIICLGCLTIPLRGRLPAAWSDYLLQVLQGVVAFVLAAIAPALWHAAMLISAILMVNVIHTEGRRRVFFMVALTVTALGVVASLNDVLLWYPSLIMFGVGAAASAQVRSVRSRQQNEADRRHDQILDRARIFSWEANARTGEILGVAGNVRAVLGYDAHELIGQSALLLVEADESDQVVDSYGVRSDEVHRSVRARHRDGSEVILREVRLESIIDDVVRGVSIDMTELAMASEALRHQAEHDSLTGLANRELLQNTVRALLDAEPDAEVALIVADLDRFKEVNDTLGHPVGDELLCQIAAVFESKLQGADIVARIGGDEFAFAVWGEDVDQRAHKLAQQIHQLSVAPVDVDGLKIAVSSSVGVAIAPNHGVTYSDLLKHADIAMYQAKSSGGGVRVFESTPNALSVQRLQLISEMSQAIERGEFELHVQPQVDLGNGAIVGVEGLARWRHPEHGLLLPGAFLHTIEVAADYHRFTSEMVRQAVDFASAAAAAGHHLNVAVNLGSMSFLDQSFPLRLRELLSQRRLPGSALTLEVTESDLVDVEAPVFDALKNLGMRLSIDDFGTGYSSLTRLRALAVEEVKIDRAFVAGLGVDAEDAIIVRAVMELCRLLGHEVVAEGVETRGQMEMLQRYGCRIAQGWLFAKAMPQDELLHKLKRGISYNVGRPRNLTPSFVN